MFSRILNFGAASSLRKGLLGACAVAAMSFAGVAQAAPVGFSVTAGNNPVAGDEEVQFNDGQAQSGMLLTGETNQTGFQVNFASTDMLTLSGLGQSAIKSFDGTGFHTLDIYLTAPATFTSLILKVTGIDKNSDITFTGSGVGVSGTTGNIEVGNGGSFYTVLTDAGKSFSKVTLTSLGGISEVEIGTVSQVRIGGANDPNAVPLPGVAVAGMMLLGSLGGAQGLKRLRRQTVAA